MPESRTFLVPKDIADSLRSPVRVLPLQRLEALQEWMPEAMTPEEVDHLGVQISNAAELDNPSWGGVSHGRRAEHRSLYMLGNMALLREDLVTADSVRKHLKQWPWSTEGLIGSILLKRAIRKTSQQIVNTLQTP
jgi:hypothetical protein